MRKGRFIGGLIILIIGFIVLIIGAVDYSNLMGVVNSLGGQVAIGLNQTLANQVSSALGTYLLAMIFGGILAIVGIVLMVLGFKGSGTKVKVK